VVDGVSGTGTIVGGGVIAVRYGRLSKIARKCFFANTFESKPAVGNASSGISQKTPNQPRRHWQCFHGQTDSQEIISVESGAQPGNISSSSCNGTHPITPVEL